MFLKCQPQEKELINHACSCHYQRRCKSNWPRCRITWYICWLLSERCQVYKFQV